jgi:hypothetical protein
MLSKAITFISSLSPGNFVLVTATMEVIRTNAVMAAKGFWGHRGPQAHREHE